MSEIRALIEGDNGAVLAAVRGGMVRIGDGKAEAYALPGAKQGFNTFALLRDHDGGLWIGTVDRGLLHVHQGRSDWFGQSDGLSGNTAAPLLEDLEGNVWVVTNNGLDQFRDSAVSTASMKQGLSNPRVEAVLAARDGSVWLSTRDGLDRWKDGLMTVYRKRSGRLPIQSDREGVSEIADSGLPDDFAGSLLEDAGGRIWVFSRSGAACFENGRFHPVRSLPGGFAHSVVEDSAGDLWISFDQGLFHLRDGRVERTPWTKLCSEGLAFSLAADPLEGGLWLGFTGGGVAYLKNGQIRERYGSAEGLGAGSVNNLYPDRDGALWIASQNGLSRLKNGSVHTLSGKNGLPCDSVDWLTEDDARSFWLSMGCGVVQIVRPEIEAWAADSRHKVRVTLLESSDGASNLHGGLSPRAVKSGDGRVWIIALASGVDVIDPRHIAISTIPPPVRIEDVDADEKTYEARDGLRLPARVRDVRIDYTALTFVAPAKVRFRYKLEGQDTDWREVVDTRQAQYSNLGPGGYRFRVMACNYRGLWNKAGASFDFSIAAAYYQTNLFRAACVAAFLALVWGFYRYRLRQIAHEYNARLEGRVDERLRVARDLHDTLLQSFHGLLPRFQAARNLLPARAADAGRVLDAALDDASKAITEARDAVQDLRSSAVLTNDLAKAVEAVGKELAAHQKTVDGNAIDFLVEVEGPPQDLHPILRDEVYRITGEALRNAFRHARAQQIEVEIRYDARKLRVRVRDDGAGIDPSVLQEGREKHYGLPGMRERAKAIGGQLEVWSEEGAGTEVELTIPASVAYASHVGRRFRLFKSNVETN
jgi:signal transduction histidine kinase/ligand-binding sensor domain-containing protein